jgi:hypothetical protein
MAGYDDDTSSETIKVDGPAPIKKIDGAALYRLGQELHNTFTVYASDRRLTELKWLRNLRQYLGIYDPDVESMLPTNGSRAYPRVTRAKCISVLSRIMNLMFQGSEKNWALAASPSADMNPEDVAASIQELMAIRQKEGLPSEPSEEFVDTAVQRLADKRSKQLEALIEDQLTELGGDQTADYVNLNRKVAMSGIMYGMGVLHGPFVREVKKTQWATMAEGGFAPVERTNYKPQYEFRSVWDVYPDMTARRLPGGDGYFLRMVMGRSDLRKLADRPDFMPEQVKKCIKECPSGNYRAREFETELRSMGAKATVNDQKTDPQGKYEIIVWNGPITARKLKDIGVDVPEMSMADDIEAEIWMCDCKVIKADINPWRKIGITNMQTLHFFMFDEDDTSPIGNGLPNVVRDSQMSVCAATRMTLDNASVTCGPNLEVNLSLLRPDQDLKSIEPYKIWYRDDDNPASASFPAVRKVEIDGHLQELGKLVEMFMAFADMESFVGPATGGDMTQTPSEPMRTAAGQSMLRGDAALPFKDIVRNFDSFTQSVILSLVQFNRKFNPGLAPEGDYTVVARGATSLVAKEIRGMQVDLLATTMTPEERDHIDERKFIEARFGTRDMEDLLVPPEEAQRRKDARAMEAQKMSQQQSEMIAAEVRKTLSDAFKNITQGQKNAAAADAQTTNAALAILQLGMDDGEQKKSNSSSAK